MNEIYGVLSVRGTFLFLFVELDLVNHSVMSDHVLQSSQRGSFMSSFCLGPSFECKDVFSKVPLLDKIFKIHADGPPMPLAIMKISVILHSGMGMIVWSRRFTQDWPLVALKTSWIGSFGGVKLSSTGKLWMLSRELGNGCFLKALCPRPWLSMEGTPWCDFNFLCRRHDWETSWRNFLRPPPTRCMVELGTGPHSNG